MREVILRTSKSKGKKFDVLIENKTISFGATGYEHYTSGLGYKGHLDKDRRDNYEKRHRTIGDFKDIMTPSFWAYRLLWLHPTSTQALDDIDKKFNFKSKYEKVKV